MNNFASGGASIHLARVRERSPSDSSAGEGATVATVGPSPGSLSPTSPASGRGVIACAIPTWESEWVEPGVTNNHEYSE
jgi:hypothetical protein